MGNKSKEFNYYACAFFKRVAYQISGDYQLRSKIEAELDNKGCSKELNKWLRCNEGELLLFPDHIDSRYVSNSLKFWMMVLESYLRCKHHGEYDTPSPKSLWLWAASGHLEYKSESDYLSKWAVRLEGKILYFGPSEKTGYTAYRQFFLRNIGLCPVYPDSERRKDEKFGEQVERRIKRNRKLTKN